MTQQSDRDNEQKKVNILMRKTTIKKLQRAYDSLNSALESLNEEFE